MAASISTPIYEVWYVAVGRAGRHSVSVSAIWRPTAFEAAKWIGGTEAASQRGEREEGRVIPIPNSHGGK